MRFEQPPSPEKLAKTTKELEVTEKDKIETQKENTGSGFSEFSVGQVRDLISQEKDRLQEGEASKFGLERTDLLQFMINEIDRFEQWQKQSENSGQDWDAYLGGRYKALYKRAHEGTSQVTQKSAEKDLKNVQLLSRDFSISGLQELSEKSSRKVDGKRGSELPETLRPIKKYIDAKVREAGGDTFSTIAIEGLKGAHPNEGDFLGRIREMSELYRRRLEEELTKHPRRGSGDNYPENQVMTYFRKDVLTTAEKNWLEKAKQNAGQRQIEKQEPDGMHVTFIPPIETCLKEFLENVGKA